MVIKLYLINLYSIYCKMAIPNEEMKSILIFLVTMGLILLVRKVDVKVLNKELNKKKE